MRFSDLTVATGQVAAAWPLAPALPIRLASRSASALTAMTAAIVASSPWHQVASLLGFSVIGAYQENEY